MAQKSLTSIECGIFDTAALQLELAQALEDDRVYKLTDSMKKRAIHTAANYDDFKNLVACANLKPVSQKELSVFSRAKGQNLRKKKMVRKTYSNEQRSQPAAPRLDLPPACAVDFCRNWKRYLKTFEAKLRYLQVTTPVRLGEIFKADIDSDLVAEIVEVLLTSWHQNSPNTGIKAQVTTLFALSIMEALSQTIRLSLILDFFDSRQTEKLKELFKLMETDAESSQRCLEMLTTLKSKFRIE
ncbi:coiled-coil domain-containing protein 103 [Plasmopara halstedii]|uniref:Coiled-coil domain-containing protein 103 n=1 Tax=Plasmopara halstedii TaxID=4781 RepID=A0A0P1AAQ0_PLAHL|nr:coiled-coil domain-containing protein 103 [Plasmopara halstedii]CEG37514.1 coiled-coil domain-containing protein 103 [Plasmopara halstedii]|eukprot:XP_024573883.1 coiled-coil domain-containing protein 103 [Plasmopara halstedii]